MAIGTLTALILGAAAFAGTTAITSSINRSASKKADSRADEAAEKAKTEAAQESLAETQKEKKVSTARKSLLATPTSGFGPNSNLARSFLTTL